MAPSLAPQVKDTLGYQQTLEKEIEQMSEIIIFAQKKKKEKIQFMHVINIVTWSRACWLFQISQLRFSSWVLL